MFEMANLYPARTGVGYVMWFGEVGGQHGPQIKVSNRPGKFAIDDNFTISVSETPEIMTPPGSISISNKEYNLIVTWIQKNYKDLMLLWQIHETGDAITQENGDILDSEMILNRLIRV